MSPRLSAPLNFALGAAFTLLILYAVAGLALGDGMQPWGAGLWGEHPIALAVSIIVSAFGGFLLFGRVALRAPALVTICGGAVLVLLCVWLFWKRPLLISERPLFALITAVAFLVSCLAPRILAIWYRKL